MKKFFIVMIFGLLSLITEASPVKFTESITPSKITNYEMKVESDSILINNKYLPIHKYLKLDINQIDFFDNIHNDLKNSIIILSNNNGNGINEFMQHLNHDLQLSKMVLEDDQYRKYLRTINVTLVNKDLMKHIVNYNLSKLN